MLAQPFLVKIAPEDAVQAFASGCNSGVLARDHNFVLASLAKSLHYIDCEKNHHHKL